YVGMMLATGVVALVCAFRDTSRWTRVLLLVLYTYGWMMSLLDIFQHHYLLSLILTMFVCVQRARLVDLYRAPRGTEPRPAVETWAYVLLGATMFIVYVYTAGTKLEAEWWQGAVIRRQATVSLMSAQAWTKGWGVSPSAFWQAQALGAIVAECLVAAAYALAPLLDRARRRWLRLVAWVAFVAAVTLHAAAEFLLRLTIGWLLLHLGGVACVYLLAGGLLGAVCGRPAPA